jgi:hypothetical protein
LLINTPRKKLKLIDIIDVFVILQAMSFPAITKHKIPLVFLDYGDADSDESGRRTLTACLPQVYSNNDFGRFPGAFNWFMFLT